LPQPRRSSPLEKAQAPQRYSTTDPKVVFLHGLTSLLPDLCRLARGVPPRLLQGSGRRLHPDPHRGCRRLHRLLCGSGSARSPQVCHTDPARALSTRCANEVACRRASGHPRYDLDFGSVDEGTDDRSLLVVERRTVFPSARTVDEQLPPYSEDRARVTRCCRASRAPCLEWHGGA